ncbi:MULTISPECIES: cation acetate symporter [unclassified Pseudonocardia]|uniref:solute symporter family protein n=1 Tax=unclassified Pseudonocardia TaxID=2619320 RepID=UPI0001FFE708|nr:cation acetate symporter [Pseudonocardia sp. Ae707_Ps1]OLM18243.1 Acetate permease ActP (cation/acetate symporter) [Pseudonocardia sp. Ae707_Ps1]
MSASPLTLSVFAAIIAVTLGITFWAGRRNSGAGDHFVAGGQLTGWQNGLAIVGDLLSAATLLGTVGILALKGVYGYFFTVGGSIAYLLVLLLFAEPLRNLGRYTMADVLASRFRSTAVRASMAVNSLIVTIFYMVAQLVAAGALIGLLLGIPYWVAVIVVGLLMTVYIAVGGMLATSWIQIVKAVLIMSCLLVMTVLVLARFGFSPFEVFRAARAASPVNLFDYVGGVLPGLELMSVAIAVGLGTAAMPHILIRFLTVPDAKAARSSMNVALVLTGIAFLTVPILGFGAVALLGTDAITGADSAGNLATLQLAELLGGPLLFAVVAAVAFATILAVVAGLVIAGSGALAHDLYHTILRKGRSSEREQVNAGRTTAVLISGVSILLSLAAQSVNLTVLSAVAVVVAASANVPVLLLLLFWRRLNTRGVITGITTGLASSVLLIVVGPLVLGANALYPLTYPTLVSIPLGFLGCYLGTVLGPQTVRDDEATYEELQIRAAIGRAPAHQEESV